VENVSILKPSQNKTGRKFF
jgi:hypothetical protein